LTVLEGAKAQKYNDVVINLAARRIHLKNIHYVPFNKVVVLDNRYDTSKLYIFETGQYPLATVRLSEPAKDAIRKYIENAIAPVRKGDKTLLVNIRELYIPNRGIMVKKRIERPGPAAHNYFYSRMYIRFYSDIYIQSGENVFKKIADLQVEYQMMPTADASGDNIRFLLNELIRCASIPNENIPDSNNSGKPKSYWVRDSIGYFFSTDTSNISINQIDVPAITRWKHTPIMSSNLTKNGVYEGFVDFQSDRITRTAAIALVYNEEDSLFKMSPTDSAIFSRQKMPWAICSDGQLYIHLWGSVFQKLTKMNSSFEFHVPYSLPDIYTILSLYANNRNLVLAPAPTGNIFVDIGTLAGSAAANTAAKGSRAKGIIEEDKEHNFRTCLINMDSGDFIYF
jgi:hypothetical protein